MGWNARLDLAGLVKYTAKPDFPSLKRNLTVRGLPNPGTSLLSAYLSGVPLHRATVEIILRRKKAVKRVNSV